MKIQTKNKSMSSIFGLMAIAAAICFSVVIGLSPAYAQDFKISPDGFNTSGVIIIADQYNNRVIEVDTKGNIIWQYGMGPKDFSAKSIIGVNDAQRVGNMVLMTGTGIPADTVPNCKNPNGCQDNRIVLVNKAGQIVWQYGQFKVNGSGFNELNFPVQSTWLPNNHVLITDQGNQRVIEVDHNKNIVWQYGTTGVSGNGFNELNDPNSAELLDNGHILISDEGNDRAIEVDRDHHIIMTFTAKSSVSGVAFSSRLPGGNTLITDSNHSRIVEVNAADDVVWQYFTNTVPHSAANPQPSRAVRLKNGNTLISDQFNHRVIEVNPAKHIVVSFGNINDPGYGIFSTNKGLYGPYDAKVIDDFTGLTPPIK